MWTFFGVTIPTLQFIIAISVASPMHFQNNKGPTYKILRKLKNDLTQQIAVRVLFSTYHLPHSNTHNKGFITQNFISKDNKYWKENERPLDLNNFVKLDKRHPRYFQRIFVHSRDERKPVPKSDLREYPYYNIVRLSVGCTGTLITPSFVLTAAHCVHNGKSFKHNINLLKVEILHRINYRIHYVREIIVPQTWLDSREEPATYQTAYDYALIKLQKPVTGRKHFTPLFVPGPIISDELYFLGYSWHTHLQLWKSECSGWGSRTWLHGNVLVSHCDSVVGNSGAAVFMEDRRTNRRKLIGVLSSHSKTSGNIVNTQVTLTSLLTADKLNEICSIISPEGEKHGVCTPQTYNYENYEFKRLPFYG